MATIRTSEGYSPAGAIIANIRSSAPHSAALWLLWWPLLAAAVSLAADPGFIELAIPLRDGRFYSLHSFLSECDRKLGTSNWLEKIPERELELTGPEKAALLLASQTGLIKARFEPDRLVLLLPDSQDNGTRRRLHNRLGKLLGIPLNEWPAKLGLHIPQNFDASRRTVLLIHGLESDAARLRPMSRAFERWGAQVLIFDYPNDGPIAWSGDRLSQDLRELVARNPAVKCAIVAHSMGGLVARYALETPGKNPGGITDLFLLGTPNDGTRLSRLQPWIEFVGEIVPRPLHFADALRDGLGEAAKDLQPGSRFLTALNAHGRAAGVRYFCAAGRKSFLTGEKRSAIEAELTQLAGREAISRATLHELLGLLNSDELANGKGDGAVTLRSANLPGAQAESVFDLNHLELITPPAADEPGDGAVFQWIVANLNWKRAQE